MHANTHARMHTDALNMVNSGKLHQRDQATEITEKEDESINDADLIENRESSSKINKKKKKASRSLVFGVNWKLLPQLPVLLLFTTS